MRIPFGIQSYKHTSLPLSAQRMVNCFLEPAPPNAKTFAAVVSAFGVADWAASLGAFRGAKVVRGVLYWCAGTSLYRVNAAGIATTLGTILGTGHVFIEGDEINVMVVNPASTDGWFWNGSVVAKITDEDWPGAVWLGYLNGYYTIIAPSSGQFYITANRNPASIDALEFGSAERYPDDLVTGIVDHAELILFGTESYEGYYDSGNADFPLTKIASADGEIGCLCPRGPRKADNSVFFPGSDGKVYRLNGYQPVAVSTPVVEQAIKRATDRDFIGFTWGEPGHEFYSLKCADFAFVYDIKNDLWHERASHGLAAWRWAGVFRAYEEWIVADAETGKLGRLSGDIFTEFGNVMRAECTSPSVGDDNRRTKHTRVELVFETGVGLVAGQGADPQVMLQFSDNDGRTWSNEKWRSLGRMGRYKTRVQWWRLGSARGRIYRYAISDPVRRTLVLATTKARLREERLHAA